MQQHTKMEVGTSLIIPTTCPVVRTYVSNPPFSLGDGGPAVINGWTALTVFAVRAVFVSLSLGLRFADGDSSGIRFVCSDLDQEQFGFVRTMMMMSVFLWSSTTPHFKWNLKLWFLCNLDFSCIVMELNARLKGQVSARCTPLTPPHPFHSPWQD